MGRWNCVPDARHRQVPIARSLRQRTAASGDSTDEQSNNWNRHLPHENPRLICGRCRMHSLARSGSRKWSKSGPRRATATQLPREIMPARPHSGMPGRAESLLSDEREANALHLADILHSQRSGAQVCLGRTNRGWSTYRQCGPERPKHGCSCTNPSCLMLRRCSR